MQSLAGLIVVSVVLSPCIVAGDNAVAAASAAGASLTSYPDSYSCQCNYNYDPVCGTNGMTYSNICLLKCASKRNVERELSPIYIASHNECPKNDCICHTTVKPVCGTNNQTYSNECYMGCENKWRKKYGLPLIHVAYHGMCHRIHCGCSDLVIAVCGTDGKTYRNICRLQCASRTKVAKDLPPIHIKSIGKCPVENCTCPAITEPLCGSDRITYNNKCLLGCHNRRLQELGYPPVFSLHNGACRNCACKKVYNPVCASDKRTYANPCIFKCENERRASHNMPSLTSSPGPCPNPCKNNYDPYCASNNKTYRNSCLLDYENMLRAVQGLPALTIRHRGVCQCVCPKTYDPVCASDDRSYLNKCQLDCENTYRVQNTQSPLKVVSKGECPCLCPLIYSPWCASDNKTYPNGCSLDCENTSRMLRGLRPLTIRNKGPCPCTCLDIYKPVCACDGKTYYNECYLKCENRRRLQQGKLELTIESIGECPCPCPKKYDPLCASNNQTYGNRCLLDCINDTRAGFGLASLIVKHRGECCCECKHCSDDYQPVCGSDKKTYRNICWLHCRNNCFKYTSLAIITVAKHGDC